MSSNITRLGQRAIQKARPWNCVQTKTFAARSPPETEIDVEDLLSKPTWSVASLLTNSNLSQREQVTSKQLHHLLRLSALPPPRSQAEEDEMLATLTTQLHFVQQIQKADTANVKPLRSLLDESSRGEEAATIGLDDLQEALACEEIKGKYHKRIRRRREIPTEGYIKENGQRWNPLETAEKKVGRYFVVDGSKD